MTAMKNRNYCIFILFSLLFVTAFVSDCEAGAGHHHDDEGEEDKPEARKLKIVGIAVILLAGALGVLLPILGGWVPGLRPGENFFFVIKAFAAGVILATAFIHILPESFERLGSEELNEDPWHKFPFAGFIAMLSAMATLTTETLATSYYKRRYVGKAGAASDGDEEKAREHADVDPVHSLQVFPGPEEVGLTAHTIRQRVIAQVLELGIVVHSVIIGITVGTSQVPSTIRPLVIALSFHQFFEGMGLGSCIVQSQFHVVKVAIMALFFSITTPVGIAIGIGVASSYDNDSATSLIVQGVLDAASAGILIYMALVDLLAADFMSPKMQNSGKLQLMAHVGLLLGAGAMSVLAKWA